MTNEAVNQAADEKKAAVFWMLLPVLLLVTSVSGWLVMVSIAVDDPGFAVEPDYYKKAANFDDVIEQRAENKRLGYLVAVDSLASSGPSEARLVLSIKDRLGAELTDVRVMVEALPVARAFDVQKVELERGADGAFSAVLSRPRLGLWEVRVTIERGAERFTEVLRPELIASASSKGVPLGGELPI